MTPTQPSTHATREELLALLSLSRSLTEQLSRENSQLRLLVASAHNIPCIHCGLEDMSKCRKGFPGCAKADDIICGHNSWQTEVRKERDDAKAEVTRLQSMLLDSPTVEKHTLVQRLETANRVADECEERLRRECEDWACDHTHLQKLCRQAGFSNDQVNGDSMGIPVISGLVDMLYSKVEELRELLKDAEWSEWSHHGQGYICRECHRSQSEGHAPDCRWDKALKGEQ